MKPLKSQQKQWENYDDHLGIKENTDKVNCIKKQLLSSWQKQPQTTSTIKRGQSGNHFTKEHFPKQRWPTN